MEVPVKLGIEGLSQMARDRFMAIFQATPGKRSRTGLQTPRHWENPEQWREPSREATVLQGCRGAPWPHQWCRKPSEVGMESPEWEPGSLQRTDVRICLETSLGRLTN